MPEGRTRLNVVQMITIGTWMKTYAEDVKVLSPDDLAAAVQTGCDVTASAASLVRLRKQLGIVAAKAPRAPWAPRSGGKYAVLEAHQDLEARVAALEARVQ